MCLLSTPLAQHTHTHTHKTNWPKPFFWMLMATRTEIQNPVSFAIKITRIAFIIEIILWYYFAIFDWFHAIFADSKNHHPNMCENREKIRERRKKNHTRFLFHRKVTQMISIFFFCGFAWYVFLFAVIYSFFFVYVQSFAWFEHATNVGSETEKKYVLNQRARIRQRFFFFWSRINFNVFVSGKSICEFFISFHN